MSRGASTLMAIAAMLVWSTSHAEGLDALPRAREALKKLGFVEARTALDEALKQGRHTRAELLEIYALRGEVAAVLDGPDASETEFRKLLVLDPAHAPPASATPRFRAPFDAARKWAETSGGFVVSTQVLAFSGQSFDIVEQIVSDPLAMAASLEVDYRLGPDGPITKVVSQAWRQTLPFPVGATRFEVSVLDRWGNVLAVSTPTAPEVRTPPTISSRVDARTTPHVPPSSATKTGWALIGSGIAGGIIGGALLGESLSAVRSARDATVRSDYLSDASRSRTFEGVGGALVAAGSCLVIAGSVVLIHHAVRARH